MKEGRKEGRAEDLPNEPAPVLLQQGKTIDSLLDYLLTRVINGVAAAVRHGKLR